MNALIRKRILIPLGMLLMIAPAHAAISDDSGYEAGYEAAYETWQLKRLFEPEIAEVRQESGGLVFIYESIKDKDVSIAMDNNWDRIENMMFVGTIVTDENGEPKLDPETNLAMTEDDGC